MHMQGEDMTVLNECMNVCMNMQSRYGALRCFYTLLIA